MAERLAPQGAARLVTGGWLPGPLVEQVSRSAVQLLNLDVAGAAEAVPSGPVEFSTPSVRPPTGVFGPPPDLATPAYMPAPRPAEAQPRPEPQPQPQPQPQSQPPAQPQDAVPGVPLAVAPSPGRPAGSR
uniref:Uncharacterized protein n=1 Tax=Streptomyces avermitilis TaxID=33903 RepID=A0A499VJ31_STRAX|nr:hypothetical protein SAVMC3_55190 [Streptomyces avermitilis]